MKILYVTTISDTINAFLVSHIKMLVGQGHSVDIACRIKKPIDQELEYLKCKIFDIPFTRAQLDKDNFTAYKQLKLIIKNNHYNIVHTHTPVASACARLACCKLRKDGLIVIYTAHGFHFYKSAPIRNWLVYYPIEVILSRYTDVLITINKEDYALAKKRMKAKKIEYIPGVGVDTKKFSGCVIDRAAKRRELGIPEDAIVLLSVGELNKNKNHETVIRALHATNIPNMYYLIAGSGELYRPLKDLIAQLNLEKNVLLLKFRDDVNELYKISDAYCLPSYREGLNISLIEAMSSGLPVICSDIRGNRDLISKEGGGYLFDPHKIDDIKEAILKICGGRNLSLMKSINSRSAELFEVRAILERMHVLYSG